jgi:hypothetical protein
MKAAEMLAGAWLTLVLEAKSSQNLLDVPFGCPSKASEYKFQCIFFIQIIYYRAGRIWPA